MSGESNMLVDDELAFDGAAGSPIVSSIPADTTRAQTNSLQFPDTIKYIYWPSAAATRP
ncbi:hypothetical protein PPTG_22955 [Phytophthora nicotianae INRA-310]|uniref:Uncharacterized protein n=2 Tax=Phytophthora nicotianae TaxID=4792 RepID=W2Q8W0_PHYN3|nr:hypothetical protein PPTG_22955 [Phytophthora nicotianae INRA-310]ETN08705.1 hypothetical protein PPTG_22955 [Phytophthora nicotianae INRA-310]